MDGETFSLRWEEERTPETIIPDMDQTAAENLMYLSQDVVSYTDPGVLDDAGVECVTEEVITDDWVVPGGQERVEVPLEQLTQPSLLELKEENDIDVPLPTDQDEYTAMRPWPCDFCSRRFRKKAALMNHMVAHQSDRPHACNLCGVRYVRKTDLINHLKVHAFVPENEDEMDYDHVMENHTLPKPKKKRGRRKKIPEPPKEEENEELWENMTSARTQQWSRKRPPAPLPPSPPSPPPPPSPAPPADPARPFECKHCGIGFAREKALQSHSRVHGGDSPIECSSCGELCWSREALHSHMRRRHPAAEPIPSEDSADSDDAEFRLSPAAESRVQCPRGPELFCQHCGVAFQRADLLRRHVHAAHSYRRHDSEMTEEHTCDVCGDTCSDALSLLAHAESHAAPAAPHRIKSRNKSRNTISNNGRQFPCKECGKVFGSRSSQQIHVRIHTGERPYACRFCWKAFADGGTLRKHERIHTGEKPYACAVCPRAFNQRVVLREHVRSHHSAPARRAAGGPTYLCVVCGRALPSSAELVQHLIQHCDANTALKRQPQSGPRKYKRRRKLKETAKRSSSPSPSPSPPPPPPRRRRRSPPPRPRMIHTTVEDVRPRTKQVRGRNRRPPRHPADDLRAIRPHLTPPSPQPSPEPSPEPSPVPSPEQSPEHSPEHSPERSPSPDLVQAKQEPQDADESEEWPGGGFRCEMCALSFPRRDELLLHVPVHI